MNYELFKKDNLTQNELKEIKTYASLFALYETQFGEILGIEHFNLLLVLSVISKGAYLKADGKIIYIKNVSFSFNDGTFSFHHRSKCYFRDYEDYLKEWSTLREDLEETNNDN